MSSITPDFKDMNNNFITDINLNGNDILNIDNLQVTNINGSTYVLPLSNRESSSTVTTINTGYATVLTNNITTTAAFDINIWATINYSFVHNANGVFANVRVLFDGNPIGQVQKISLDYNNQFGQVFIIASQLNTSIGSHSITLQMQKSAALGTLTSLNCVSIVNGNIE
jgi:hypothetical protein